MRSLESQIVKTNSQFVKISFPFENQNAKVIDV